jgi:hypothetical protein
MSDFSLNRSSDTHIRPLRPKYQQLVDEQHEFSPSLISSYEAEIFTSVHALKNYADEEASTFLV